MEQQYSDASINGNSTLMTMYKFQADLRSKSPPKPRRGRWTTTKQPYFPAQGIASHQRVSSYHSVSRHEQYSDLGSQACVPAARLRLLVLSHRHGPLATVVHSRTFIPGTALRRHGPDKLLQDGCPRANRSPKNAGTTRLT